MHTFSHPYNIIAMAILSQTYNIINFILVVQIGLQISHAQFPSVCTDKNLTTKECCPNLSGRGKCGVQDGRGECRGISSKPVDDSTSVRDGWPYYFTRVCMCTGNYAGYDCGRCKYGYHGEDCSNFNIKERKSLSELSAEDWKNYVNILSKSKIHNSGYKVFLKEPEQKAYDIMLSLLQPTPISLYDLFIWQHHYAAKDNGIKGKL